MGGEESGQREVERRNALRQKIREKMKRGGSAKKLVKQLKRGAQGEESESESEYESESDSGFESAQEEEEEAYFSASEEPDLGGTKALRKIGERTARGYKQRLREEIGGTRELRKKAEEVARRHRLITGEEQKLGFEEQKQEQPKETKRVKKSPQSSSRKRYLKNLGLTLGLAGMTAANLPDVQSTAVGQYLPRGQNLYLPQVQNVSNPFLRNQNWCDVNGCNSDELEIAERISKRLSGNSTMDRNVWDEVQRRTQEEILNLRRAKGENSPKRKTPKRKTPKRKFPKKTPKRKTPKRKTSVRRRR